MSTSKHTEKMEERLDLIHRQLDAQSANATATGFHGANAATIRRLYAAQYAPQFTDAAQHATGDRLVSVFTDAWDAAHAPARDAGTIVRAQPISADSWQHGNLVVSNGGYWLSEADQLAEAASIADVLRDGEIDELEYAGAVTGWEPFTAVYTSVRWYDNGTEYESLAWLVEEAS